MRFALTASLARAFPTVFAGCAAALLAATATTGSLVAQVQAFYPLMTDLFDATSTYGAISLTGNPPPAPPNNGVCVNGVYFYNAGGQDVRSPNIVSLTTTDFQVDVEFQINGFPAVQGPVLMGGTGWRWLGIYLQSSGTVGIKHNNSNITWSSTQLTTGNWYAATLKYEAGVVQLFLNGSLVQQTAVGALNDGNNKNFTTNDFSVGANFNGCIRNLLITNDTDMSLATATTYGAGCVGSAGVPSLVPANLPQLGTTFTQNATNLAASAVFAFMAVGFSDTTSLLGPLPASLQPLGLGPNCDLWVSTDASVLFPVASGSGAFQFPVPADAGLVGLALFFQCASIDAGATGGIALTNAVDAVIGY